MKLCIFYIRIGLLIKLVFSGCHTGTIITGTNHKLAIQTNAVVSWAGSDSSLYANIYSDSRWNGWRNLDNSGCNDFGKGAVDYFDDFDSITTSWEAISLYICGNDGILIENIHYWNGANMKTVSHWRPGIFGPFPRNCLYDDTLSASAETNDASYSDIQLDGNTECCDGVTFTFEPDNFILYGSVWTGKLSGEPDCSGEHGNAAPVIHRRPDNYYPPHNTDVATAFEEKLLNYLMIVIGIAALLFISNSCLITVMVKNGYRFNNRTTNYHPVKVMDSSDEAESRRLNQ